MAKKRYPSLLIMASLMLVTQVLAAQRVEKREPVERVPEVTEQPVEERRPNTLQSRLWYGGGVQLGFSGYNGISVFSFGISPMVGYKIIDQVSVGPRVEITYASLKQSGFKAIGLFDVDAGVFIRGKVYRGFFLQGELSNEWVQQAIAGSNDKISVQRFNQRIGAGWNFGNGQGGGSEIGVFYNFAIASDINSYENPLGYRFGFTWNF